MDSKRTRKVISQANNLTYSRRKELAEYIVHREKEEQDEMEDTKKSKSKKRKNTKEGKEEETSPMEVDNEVPKEKKTRKAKRPKVVSPVSDFVEIQPLPDEIERKLEDKETPKGQRRTGVAKKFVYILPGTVYKGPYESNERLIKFIFRTEVFKLLGSKVLLPSGYFKSSKGGIYVAFPNIATTAPETWKTVMDVESDHMGGGFVRIVERDCLGISTLAEIFKKTGNLEEQKAFPVFEALLDAFCLGVGDTHLGNVLSAGEMWLIDYEDDSQRNLEKATIGDFLFKANPGAAVAKATTDIIEKRKADLQRRLEKTQDMVPQLQSLAKKYNVPLEMEKRIAFAMEMLTRGHSEQ